MLGLYTVVTELGVQNFASRGGTYQIVLSHLGIKEMPSTAGK
jgi:hypothetical protein